MSEFAEVAFKKRVHSALEVSNETLIPSLTLLLLLIKFAVGLMPKFGSPFIGAVLCVLCAVALIHRPLQLNRYLWGAITACQMVFLALYWQFHDNHNYLICYWSFALFLGLWFDEDERLKAWALSAATLLGATMLVAVAQKCRSEFYLDGSFFLYRFLTDPRFEFLGMIADVDLHPIIEQNYQILDQLKSNTKVATLVGANDLLRNLASVMTWWGIILEALIGIFFLLPKSNRFAYWGHPLLLVFCGTVYALLPVRGFAMVLLLMGLVQTKPEQALLRGTYLVFMIYIFLLAAPVLNVVS